MSHSRVFGCMAYAHVPEIESRKLDKKAIKLRFLRDSSSQKGYRLLDIKKRKIIVSRDVPFNGADFGHQKQVVDVEASTDVDAEFAVEDVQRL